MKNLRHKTSATNQSKLARDRGPKFETSVSSFSNSKTLNKSMAPLSNTYKGKALAVTTNQFILLVAERWSRIDAALHNWEALEVRQETAQHPIYPETGT